MIQLRFNSLAGTDPALLGPAPFFRIEGTLLRQGGEASSVVGRYEDHHWEIGSRSVSSYECVEPAMLHFESATEERSRVYGPFKQVRFPNGSCYADLALFAELVEERGAASAAHGRLCWRHRSDSSHWPVLMIRPAAHP